MFVVQIPQRFITVNGLTPFDVGVRLLPFGVLVPGTSVIASILIKQRVPAYYIQLARAVLQLVGTTLFSQLPTSYSITPSQYGFQILTGAGIGCSNIALLLVVPYVNDPRDLGK